MVKSEIDCIIILEVWIKQIFCTLQIKNPPRLYIFSKNKTDLEWEITVKITNELYQEYIR